MSAAGDGSQPTAVSTAPGLHGGALRRLGEVDRLDGALLDAGPAEGAGVEVDGAHHAAVVELGEDRLARAVAGHLWADRSRRLLQLMQSPVTMLGSRLRAISKSPGRPLTDSTVVRRQTCRLGSSMATLRWKHLRVPAWASVVGRHWPQSLVGKHGADAGGAAAQERAALDELDAMAHLGELDGGLRARHAAADHEHAVDLVRAGQRVGRGAGVAQARRARCAPPWPSRPPCRRRAPTSSPRGCRRSRGAGRAPRGAGSGGPRSRASSRRRPGAAGRSP